MRPNTNEKTRKNCLSHVPYAHRRKSYFFNSFRCPCQKYIATLNRVYFLLFNIRLCYHSSFMRKFIIIVYNTISYKRKARRKKISSLAYSILEFC